MYLRNKLVSLLNIINIFTVAISAVMIIFGITDILSLLQHYWGDWFTIRHAKSTPESVFMICLGSLLLMIFSYFSAKIKNARFYSSYFECDLDGRIEYADLADVTGKSPFRIRCELALIMHIYMKRYRLRSDGKTHFIELHSKKCICICNHCGAVIEKSAYFVGVCPYCSGSDLNAKVLTDNQFYNISRDDSESTKTSKYYENTNIRKKLILACVLTTIAGSLAVIFLIYSIDTLKNVINFDKYIKDYYHGVIFEGKPQVEPRALKRESLISDVIFGVGFILSQTVFLVSGIKVLISSKRTQKFSAVLARSKTPFLRISQLKNRLHMKKPFKCAFNLIRNGYLKNCTFEKHSDEVKLALAKKVQKDICPDCGAPITGAVDDKYVCPYCSQPIMKVVVKK